MPRPADRLAIAAFVVLAAAVMLMPGLDPSGRSWALCALVAPLMAYLGWQRWRYALGLDELARRLYLEAFAITYLVGLPLFLLFALLHEVAGWTVSPWAIVVLGPIRAAVLVWRTRRFA